MLKRYINGKNNFMLMERKMTLSIRLYSPMSEAGGNISTVQRTVAKESENGFLLMFCDTLRGNQRHAHYPRKVFTYCRPTIV